MSTGETNNPPLTTAPPKKGRAPTNDTGSSFPRAGGPPKTSSVALLLGINAVHVNSAREMYLMSTRSRREPGFIENRDRFKAPVTFPAPASMATTVRVPAKLHQGKCNNPQCTHCGSVIIPAPSSLLPALDSPSISIGDWEIFTVRKPILSAPEIDRYEEELRLPLPEMIFGKNQVIIRNSKRNWEIAFKLIDALDTVLKIGCDPNKLLKVAHSQHWFLKKKKLSLVTEEGVLSSEMYDTEVPVDLLNEHVTKMIKPYDWTYTPNYSGTLSGIAFKPSDKQIPLDKLKRPDPILFFDDVVLYEDELADNGITVMQVKIRVMEHRLLLLCRFFLRIDDVIFKIRDVRVFVEFAENLVLRDIKEQEDTYQNVFKKVLRTAGGSDPRYYLRNIDWVAQNLKTTSHTVEEAILSDSFEGLGELNVEK